MFQNHTFKAKLNWNKKSKEELLENRKSIKSHIIYIEGKSPLNVSAAKSFKGDSTLYNPEDLLLSSLISCHMMSYLYCCSINNIDVLSYEDNAEAILEVNSDGSGKIVKVILNPKVKINDISLKDLAISLYQEANKLCFIANSCNFSILHKITILG